MKTNFYRIGLACLSSLIFSCSAEETTSSDNQELLDRIEELEAQINDADDLQSYIDQIALLEREIEDLESSAETYDPDLLASLQAQIEELQTRLDNHEEVIDDFDELNLNTVTVTINEYQDASTGFDDVFEASQGTFTFDKLLTSGYTEVYIINNDDGSVGYYFNLDGFSDHTYFNSEVDNFFHFDLNLNNGVVSLGELNIYLIGDFGYYRLLYPYDYNNLNAEVLYENLEFNVSEINLDTNQLTFNLSVTTISTKNVDSQEVTVKQDFSISFDNEVQILGER